VKRRHFGTWVKVALCSSVWAWSGRATAGNDDQLPVGGEASIYGGAVFATVSDGAAGYHNPAGLSQSRRNQLDASITAVGFRFYTASELLRSPSGEATGVTMMEFVMAPTSGTYTRRLNDKVVVSFGIFSPRTQFLIMQKALRLAEPSPQGTDWNVAINSIIFTYLIGPSVAYEVSRQFSVGASLHVLYNFEDAAAQAAGAERNAGAEPPQQPFLGNSQLFVRSTYGLQLGWGFQWQPSSQYRIGFSMQSPGLQVLTWRQTTDSAGISLPVTNTGAVSTHTLATNEGFQSKLQLVLPLRSGLGIARFFDWGRVEVGLAYQSALPESELGPARKAVFNARVGGQYRLSPTLSLGAGLFTDRAATDASSFGRFHVDMYGGTLGIATGTEHRLREGERAKSLVFASTLGLRYAYGHGAMGTLEVSPIAPGSPVARPFESPMTIHEITLNFGSALNF
jgi:long-subunit fatty acid transport protein